MHVLFLGLLIVLFMLGMPVGFSIGVTAVVVMILDVGLRSALIPQMIIAGVNSFPVLAVPMFLLAGKLMNAGSITDRMFGLARVLVGFLPGGLGFVNVLASVIFTGKSGTAVADIAGLGPIQIKAMRTAGYDDDFIVGVSGASSTLGPVFPPSVPLIIYGSIASASVGALFLGGLVPGVIMTLLMLGMVSVFAAKRKYPRDPVPTIGTVVTAVKRGFLSCISPVVIIAGIYTGWFTPTEAAVIVVLYEIVLTVFVYRDITFKDVAKLIRETALDVAAIGILIGMASLYGNVIVRARIPQAILAFLTDNVGSTLMLLLVLNLFLLFVGSFMETVACITIFVPLFLPMLIAMDVNLIHFGLILVVNLMISVLTPPFGIVLFVVCKISGLSVLRATKALLPWMLVLVVALAIVTLFPETVLFLPRMAGLIS